MPLLREQLALFTVMPDTTKVKQPASGYSFNYGNYQVGIKQEDCIQFLQSLPDKSIDIIVTDPAYAGMNNHLQLGRGRIVGKYEHKGSENGKWFAEFEDTDENYRTFLAECRRVLSNSTGHIYIMFDSFSLLTLGSLVRDCFDVKNLITWDKINIGMGHYFRRRHEYVIFATNGNNRKIRNHAIPDIWRFKRIYRAEYVTQKPVELFQAMIYASAEEGFTVCDPFMGSGSSAVAAIKNNCNFVGCDISDKAIELSRKRIEQLLATGQDCLQPKQQFSVCRICLGMNSQAATKNVLKHVRGGVPQPVLTGFVCQPSVSTDGERRHHLRLRIAAAQTLIFTGRKNFLGVICGNDNRENKSVFCHFTPLASQNAG